MGKHDREIEIKLLTQEYTSLPAVDKIVCGALKDLVQCRPVIYGCATDSYYDSPEDSDADFVRIRELDEPKNPHIPAEVTAKASDRGGNVNRIEMDLGIESASQGNKLMALLLGDMKGRVTKRYTVYFMEDQDTTVSVYKVFKDKRVFVEVEATSLRRVKELIAVLQAAGLEFVRVEQSLFQLFVKHVPMTTVPV